MPLIISVLFKARKINQNREINRAAYSNTSLTIPNVFGTLVANKGFTSVLSVQDVAPPLATIILGVVLIQINTLLTHTQLLISANYLSGTLPVNLIQQIPPNSWFTQAFLLYLHMQTQQKIIIITAPSGAGKTSITRYLLAKYPLLAFSVSAATRLPRGNEKDGVDYYFMSPAGFQEKIKANAFVEWEMVYEGKYYGTLKTELERIWQAGKTPMLDIDVKGAIHVQQQFPQSALSIFIEPPSIEELRKRLESRGTETPESIATRLNKASYEISFKNHFNEVVVNDDLDKACTITENIIRKFLGW